MILAAATSHPTSHLLTNTIIVSAVLVAVLLFIKLIYWALNVWEKWRIIAHYRREEQRDAALHQKKTHHKKEGK